MSAATIAPSKGRFQQLDALRAVAIGVVMLHHYINPPILLSGFGVTFLFVLSGYFATNTLLKLRRQMTEGRTDLSNAVKDFYLRRYLRICPMYFIVLLVTALFNVEGARESLPWNAFFLANIQTLITGQWNGRFAPLWSLSFLEQFYLIWPFVVLVLPRKKLVPALIAMTLLGPAWRFICFQYNLSGIDWCISPLSCCDAVGCGALLAVVLGMPGEEMARRNLIAAARWVGVPAYAALLLAKAFHHQPWFTEILIPATASLAFVWLVEKACRGFKGIGGTIFENGTISQIGRMSYSIFLIHTFTELLLPRVGVIGKILDTNYRCFLLIPGSICLAYMTWFFIEKPIMEMRRRIPRPSLTELEPEGTAAAAVVVAD